MGYSGPQERVVSYGAVGVSGCWRGDSALTAGAMWVLGAAADMDVTLGGPDAPLSGLDSALKISTWSLAGLCCWHLDAQVCLFLHRRHGRQECHEAE